MFFYTVPFTSPNTLLAPAATDGCLKTEWRPHNKTGKIDAKNNVDKVPVTANKMKTPTQNAPRRVGVGTCVPLTIIGPLTKKR